MIWRRVRIEPDDRLSHRRACRSTTPAARDDDYFADGMTDEVRSKLSAIPGLQVTARTSTSQYKRSKKDPRDIGRELSVDYLLTGTVRWNRGQGARPRAGHAGAHSGLELVDHAGRSHSTRCCRTCSRCRRTSRRAWPTGSTSPSRRRRRSVSPSGRRRTSTPMTNSSRASRPRPMSEALRGHSDTTSAPSRSTRASSRRGRRLRARWRMRPTTSPTVEGVERARVAAERALALGPNRAEGHLAMAHVSSLDQARLRGRARGSTRPGSAPSRITPICSCGIATVDRVLGRFDDALAHAQQAFKVDPRSVSTARRVAMALHDLRRYPEELAAWDRALALAPKNLGNIQGKVVRVSVARPARQRARARRGASSRSSTRRRCSSGSRSIKRRCGRCRRRSGPRSSSSR